MRHLQLSHKSNGRIVLRFASKLAFALALLCLSLSACNQKAKPAGNTAGEGGAKVKSSVKPEPDSQVAVIDTADFGRIVIELYPNIAPQMVERFKKLINEKFYDGTAIHRIDPDLGIIQGGDPLTKGGNPAMWGTGNSPYPNVPAEFSDIPYERGTVGAARTNDVNTANCQWFITLKTQPAFDQKYTVFGKVIDGIKNAEIIMGAPTQEGGERPSPPVRITSVTLQPRASYAK
jgi:cyclophilin family peptidyl-prolyl cis-trans isomerase/predicted small secreted protein